MANAVTSRTGSVSTGVVTHKLPAKAQGVHLYLKYAKGAGTSVLITPTFIHRDLNATDEYQQVYFNSSMAPAPLAYTLTASGNYRIPIPMALGETELKLTVAFTGGTDQTLIADVRSE